MIVLEARDRVGGRAYSRSIGAGASDVANMGATFVGPTQTQIQGLMAELGIAKFATYSTGNLLWYENGKRTQYTGDRPAGRRPGGGDPAGDGRPCPAIDQMANTIPLDAPWQAPNAQEWDSMTAETWSEQNIATARGAHAVRAGGRGRAVGASPATSRSCTSCSTSPPPAASIEPLINNAGQGGAQDFRVSGRHPGDRDRRWPSSSGRKRVLLNQPVRRISQGAKSVYVYADKATVKAQQVMVAIPPTLAGRIIYEPQLSAAARPAHAADAGRVADQDDRRLRHAVLARPGPQRHR